MPFPQGISEKKNIIAWLEFELTYNDFAVQHISHYAMGTTPRSGYENIDVITVI